MERQGDCVYNKASQSKPGSNPGQTALTYSKKRSLKAHASSRPSTAASVSHAKQTSLLTIALRVN